MKKLLTASVMALYLVALMPGISVAQVTCTGTPGTMGFLPTGTVATPGTVTKNASGNITVDVIVNPAGCEAGAADVTVKYNTAELEFLASDANTMYVKTGNPTPYFPLTIPDESDGSNIPEPTPGTIRMARYISPGSTVYTTASGTFARLTFRPKVAVGQNVTLQFNYVPNDTADFTTIAGKVQGTDLLGSAPSATLTIAQAVVGAMSITSVTPASGDKNLAQTVTIVGTGFGTTQGTVKFGTVNAQSITSWSDTQIVVVAPTWPTLTTTTAVNVTVTSGANSAVKTNGYTYNVGNIDCASQPAGCYVPPVVNGDDPYISSIRPMSGNKNLSPEVEIFGGNFGFYNPEASSVAVGVKGATILDWSPNRIVAQFPAEPGLTSRSTRSVTVTRSDGKQAYFTGFTYTTGPLPNSGPEAWMWLGIVAMSLGVAGLTYYKLSVKPLPSDFDY